MERGEDRNAKCRTAVDEKIQEGYSASRSLIQPSWGSANQKSENQIILKDSTVLKSCDWPPPPIRSTNASLE